MANDCSGGPIQRFIRVALQSDFSTEGTTYKYQGVAQNADDDIAQETFESRGLEKINAVQNAAGTRTSTTSVEYDYQIGRVFELAFGTPAHAETTDDWVHTFNVETDPPYLTIVVGSETTATCAGKHKGHLVDSMSINYELNGNVKVAVSTTGNFVEGITEKPSHTVVDTAVLTYRNATFDINDVSVIRVQSASIDITHETEQVAGGEDQDISCNVLLGRTVEFTANAAINTNTYRDHIGDEDITSVGITVDNGVTLGSGKRGFAIDLDQIEITSLNETGSVGSITTFTISGVGRVSSLSATDSISEDDW